MFERPAVISTSPATVRSRPSRTFAPQVAYTSASIDGTEVHDGKNDSRTMNEDTPEEREWLMKRQDSRDFTLDW